MKKNILLTLGLAFGLLSFIPAKSQRFLTEVFAGVTETRNVVYDSNMSWPALPMVPPPLVKIGLQCDIYEPMGDTASTRPLVILLHTGSFLPPLINQQTTGARTDSSIVEMCRRFARKGYIAVAMSYRLGWNPTTTNSDTATSLLLQATYRAIQDTRNCVRFFRSNASMYKVDVSKIAIGGQGTGGYVALAYSSLNKQTEVELEKFSWSNTTPMVNTTFMGDWLGLGGIPQLNISGDAGVSTDVNFVFNYGGATADSSWIEAGETPIVSIHCVNDPLAPYGFSNVIVPTTQTTVINNACGSRETVRISQRMGNNDIINNRDYSDPFTAEASKTNEGFEGLYPLHIPKVASQFANEGSPWDWWDSVTIKSFGPFGINAHNKSMFSNPNMSKTKAMAYIDTIQGFVTPRMVCALGLPGCASKVSSVNGIDLSDMVEVYPNPATTNITVSFAEGTINTVEVYTIAGKLVTTQENANQGGTVIINRNSLPAGVYIVRVVLDKGIAYSRVIFE